MMKNNPKLDETICNFASGVFIQHLTSLQGEAAGVREAKDIEYIHRMRVASRRLRTAMALFAGCMPPKKSSEWVRQIRQITRSLGAARDADVQIDWLMKYSTQHSDPKITPGIQRLILRITQRRQRLQGQVLKSLDRLEKSGVLPDMLKQFSTECDSTEVPPVYSAQLYRYARDCIAENLKSMLSYEEIVHHPENVSELHEMRIAAKKLRYTLETFQPLYSDDIKKILGVIRSVQEHLGDIHDCDVWIVFLPEFLKEETNRMIEYLGNARMMYRYSTGIKFLEQERQSTRLKLYQNFIKDWDAWTRKGIWDQLIRLIDAPVLNMGTIYPPLM